MSQQKFIKNAKNGQFWWVFEMRQFELFSNNVNLPLNPVWKAAVVSPKIRKKNGEIKLVGSFLLSLVGVVQILALW